MAISYISNSPVEYTSSLPPQYEIRADSASFAVTASYAATSSYELQISESYAESASQAEFANSASYSVTSSYALSALSASYSVTSSYALSALTASYSIVTQNLQVTTSLSRSIYSDTASLADTASWALNAFTASLALSVDYPNITNKPTLVSSSLQFTNTDSVTFKNVTASIVSASTLIGNGSQITGVVSSSHSVNSDTASYVTNSITASFVRNAQSASYLNSGANIFLSQSYISSVTGSTAPPYQPATLFWDDNAKTYAMYSDHAGVTLQIGQESWIRAYADEYIPNGTAVYVNKSLNGLPCVRLALADGVVGSNKSEVIGLATETILSGSIGVITSVGQVHDIDTSTFVEGTNIYLSDVSSGSLTADIPPTPHEIINLGVVLVSDSTNGIVQVDISRMEQNISSFVGMTTVPTLVTGSNSVSIGTGSVNLSVSADGSGPIKNYTLNSASFNITTSSFLDAQFIVATYNSGSPIYQIVTDRSAVDSIQTTIVYMILPGAGGSISYTSYDAPGNVLANKLLLRTQAIDGIQRSSGLVLNVSASTYLTITSGSVWVGSNVESLPSINSFTNRVVLVAHSASVWSGSLITQLTNTQCDNGTNIVDLGSGANHWVSNYIYRGVGSLNTTVVMYSNDFSSLTEAKLGQPPSTPSELLETSVLVGRVIYKKGVATPEAVESAFTTTFAAAGASVHNDLSGLNVGNYLHLTAAEYAALGISSSYARTASYVETARTASYVVSALTASFVSTAQTASYVLNSVSSSFSSLALSVDYPNITNKPALVSSSLQFTNVDNVTFKNVTASIVSASTLIGNGSQITGLVSSSYSNNSTTASYVATAQTASYVVTSLTASFVTTAQTASYVLNSVSSSFSSTASYVANVASSSFASTASYWNGSTVEAVLITTASNYTVLSSDKNIYINANGGSKIVTLPLATGTGRILKIKKIDTSSNAVTVTADTTGTPDLIDGQPTQIITAPWVSITIQDGQTDAWYIQ